jgi:hypothetical protein
MFFSLVSACVFRPPALFEWRSLKSRIRAVNRPRSNQRANAGFGSIVVPAGASKSANGVVNSTSAGKPYISRLMPLSVLPEL